MEGSQWLDELGRRVMDQLKGIELSRPDCDTLALSCGLRTVVIRTNGDQAWLAPSLAVGGTLGGRLQDRVQHLDIRQYGIDEATVDVAVDAVFAHLGKVK